MAKAKAGRVASDITLVVRRAVRLRRLQRGRAAGEVGARLQDPRHLRGHPADPAADRRPPGARAVQRRAEVAGSGVQPGEREHVVGSGEPAHADEHRAHPERLQLGVAARGAGRPSPHGYAARRPPPRSGRGAARPCAQASSRSRPTTGRSSTVTATSARVRPASRQVPVAAPRACGAARRGPRAGCRRRPAGRRWRSVRRSPLPPTITGMSCAGRGYAVVSGRRRARAVVGLGAGRPERPAGLDGRLEQVEPLAGGREGQAVRRVLALPPAGADAEERPAAGQGVERGRGLRGDPGRPEGDRRAQRAERQPGVEPGDQPEGDPGLRDRLPGACRPAGSGSGGPSARSRRTPPRRRPAPISAQPGARVLAPGEPGELQHHAQPRGSERAVRSPTAGCRRVAAVRPIAGACGRSAVDHVDDVPALGREVARPPRPPGVPGRSASAAGTGRSRVGVAAAALLARGVQHDGDGRQPGGPRGVAPGRTPRARRARACRRPWSARGPSRAATMRSSRSNASVEASRSAGPQPTTPRSVVGGDDLGAAVASGGPRGLARPRCADEDDDCGIGQGHDRIVAGRVSAGVLERVVGGERPVEAGLVEPADDHLVLLASRTHLARVKLEVVRNSVPRARKAFTHGSAGR